MRRLRTIARHCSEPAATTLSYCFETTVTEVNGLAVTVVHRRPVSNDATVAPLRVEPLPVALGALVSGVELERVEWESNSGQRLGEQLRADLLRHGLLVFPGQATLSPEQNLRLCHALSGGLTLYPRERGDRADGSHDDVIDAAGQHDVAQMSGLAYYYAGAESSEAELPFFSPFLGDNPNDSSGTIRATLPARDSEGFEWHNDAAGHEDPRPLSMLYCVESPEVGGETMFLNGATALAQLKPAMRAVAERLIVHYCQGEHDGQRIAVDGGEGTEASAVDSPWDPRVRQYAPLGAAELTHKLAEVTHSHMLVRNHPVTGVPGLSTAASFVHHVEDTETGEHWSVEDSWRFISDCFVASLDHPELVYAHRYVRNCSTVMARSVGGV